MENPSLQEDLLELAKAVSGKIGEGFFLKLTEHLAKMLKADYAYIAELPPGKLDHAKTLSLIADGTFIDNIKVNLGGTPCETVIDKEVCSYPADIQKLFPRAHMMAKLNVEGYIGIPLKNSHGDPIGIMSVMYRSPITNVTKIESLLKIFASRASSEIERKRIDEALQNTLDELEARVKERTRELEESNVALKVLLKQRDNDKNNLENNVLTNIKQLILPYIDKIRNNHPDKETLISLSILELNLKEIVSPFAHKLSSNYLGLTPKEIDISNLIIGGKQDKEISMILNISPETVKSHRQNIRKKLGIYSKRTNLRTHLLSLSD